MGLLKGTASFVRFSVEGELPTNTFEFIADRVAAFSFRDIDDSFDEYSIGWVSVASMFDASFRSAGYLNGDYLTLSMRLDERKVSPAILKKCVLKEEERVRLEQQLPRLARAQRTEIKERIRAELTRKAIPVPSVYDVCWNLAEGTLLFFSTNKKAHAVFEDFFKESFGLQAVQQIPYLVAEHLLDPEAAEQLSRIAPEIFV